MNLLIADDEKIIRQGLLSIDWKKHNIEVIAAVDNGYEAVEKLQESFVDVVLTDIRMPGMDGLELAKFIAENELNVEVVVLSGYSDFEYARSAIQYGVREYLLKPTEPGEIVWAVNRAAKALQKKREKDMRLTLLEAELGRKQLVQGDDGLVLGKPETSAVAREVLEFIAVHYHEPITLTHISVQLHFSTIYLSKVIKKATEFTFLDILNGLRIMDAAARLREQSDSLSSICEAVAISDPRYFSQVFKKHYGVTPSAYKKSPCLLLDTRLACLLSQIREGRI